MHVHDGTASKGTKDQLLFERHREHLVANRGLATPHKRGRAKQFHNMHAHSLQLCAWLVASASDLAQPFGARQFWSGQRDARNLSTAASASQCSTFFRPYHSLYSCLVTNDQPFLIFQGSMETHSSFSRHASDVQEQWPLNEGSSESTDTEKSQATHDGCPVRARSLRSWRVWLECLPDVLLALTPIYFIVLAFLVYSHRGQNVDSAVNRDLLQAAKYVSSCAYSNVEEDELI